MKSVRSQLRAGRVLDARPEEVWRIIAGGDRVERWFPWVGRTELLDAREGGARIIHMRDGTSFLEYVTLNDARTHTYQYYAPAPPLPARHVLGTKRLVATGDHTELIWSVTFDPAPDAPPDLLDTLQRLYSAALEAIDALAARAPDRE